MSNLMSVSYERLRTSADVSPTVAKTMRGNKAGGTIPEVALGKALWHNGLRGYRKNVKGLPGKPDFLFTKSKVVVFVHGCFWHCCPTCREGKSPRKNSEYWLAKLKYNVQRDLKNRMALEELGYTVLIVWECEIRAFQAEVVERIREALRSKSKEKTAIS